MESAYVKTVYFDMFDDNTDIRKKLLSVPGMAGVKLENTLSKIKRDLNTIGKSQISYIQHGYGVTSQYDQVNQQIQRMRMPINNNYGDSLIASASTIKTQKTEEETNKKLLLL